MSAYKQMLASLFRSERGDHRALTPALDKMSAREHEALWAFIQGVKRTAESDGKKKGARAPWRY